MNILDDRVSAHLRGTIRILLRAGLVGLPVMLMMDIAIGLIAPHYRNQVFSPQFTAGYPVAVDPSGQRGGPVPQTRNAGVRRILVLGDSVSFGTGVAVDSAWPAQLVRACADEGLHVECINAAMPGRSLKHNLADYQQHWSSYSPDIVVLGVTNNMVSLAALQAGSEPVRRANEFLTPAGGVPEESFAGKVKRMIKRSAVPSWCSTQAQRLSYWCGLANHNVNPARPMGPMPAFGYLQAGLPADFHEEAWKSFDSDLRDLCDACARDGRPVLVVTFPVRFELTNRIVDNEKCVPKARLQYSSEMRFAESCRTRGLALADTGRDFRSELSNSPGATAALWYLHFDFTHFSRQGHAVVADRVRRELQTMLLRARGDD